MDYVWVSDAARYYVAILNLWLAALFIKITVDRVRSRGWGRQAMPHPLTTMGLAFLMFVSVARRFDNLGTPGDPFLWSVTFGTTLILVGVLINVHFTLTPPWRRPAPARH